MRFDAFLSYIGYSKETPDSVGEKRWNAMLLWHKKRKKNKDWIPKELLLVDCTISQHSHKGNEQ